MHARDAPSRSVRQMLVAPRDQPIRVELARIVTNWQIKCRDWLGQQRVVGRANAFAGIVLARAFALKLAQLDPAIADIDGHQIRKYAPFMHDSHSRQLARIPVANGRRATQLESAPPTR